MDKFAKARPLEQEKQERAARQDDGEDEPGVCDAESDGVCSDCWAQRQVAAANDAEGLFGYRRSLSSTECAIATQLDFCCCQTVMRR